MSDVPDPRTTNFEDWKAAKDRPRILPDTQTTLPEDTFRLVERDNGTGWQTFDLMCVTCDDWVCELDDGDDLNTLIRLAYEHYTNGQHT